MKKLFKITYRKTPRYGVHEPIGRTKYFITFLDTNNTENMIYNNILYGLFNSFLRFGPWSITGFYVISIFLKIKMHYYASQNNDIK